MKISAAEVIEDDKEETNNSIWAKIWGSNNQVS